MTDPLGEKPDQSGRPPPVGAFRVTRHEVRFRGGLFDVASDLVEMPDGGQSQRDYLRHPGAVAVVALDEADHVFLIWQYRHALARFFWELPAGITDRPDESLVDAARRELAEETGLGARDWMPLTAVHPSPGTSDEFVHLFLAGGLHPAPPPVAYRRRHEEAVMEVHRFPFTEAVRMAVRGEITNAVAIIGLLTVDAMRRSGELAEPGGQGGS